MDFELTQGEINTIKEILKQKNLKISAREIRAKFDRLIHSEENFPIPEQQALLVRLLRNYENTKKKEVIILEELGCDKCPITVVLGALAEDWPGMSNAILGIIHHEARNVLYVKGFTLNYKDRVLGVVILSFRLESQEELADFLVLKKELAAKIKIAAHGSADKVLLLEDETIKFDIYNKIIRHISRIYHEDDIENIVGEQGEALKFVSSRSREYLEERQIRHLARLVIDNFKFQKSVRSGKADAKIKISNFETKYEKLTGITFVCLNKQSSIEDFLETLKYIVPDHIIKHQKSFVSVNNLLVYRIEIVDRNGMPISPELIKNIEKSFERFLLPSYSETFSQIKSVGGFEHYARAIIPFLMEELKRTEITQVFMAADKKTDFSIHLKLVIVSPLGRKDVNVQLISRLNNLPGVEIISVIPPKKYPRKVELNILKLNIDLVEFKDINDVFHSLKQVLKRIFGQIRDFDEGLRGIDLRILNELINKFPTTDSQLVKEIFFNCDELFRIENPIQILEEVVKMCARTIARAEASAEDEIIYECQNIKSPTRTIMIVSFLHQRKVLGRIIKKMADVNLHFIKIRWNQRFYMIFILNKDGKPVAKEFITEVSDMIAKLTQPGKGECRGVDRQ